MYSLYPTFPSRPSQPLFTDENPLEETSLFTEMENLLTSSDQKKDSLTSRINSVIRKHLNIYIDSLMSKQVDYGIKRLSEQLQIKVYKHRKEIYLVIDRLFRYRNMSFILESPNHLTQISVWGYLTCAEYFKRCGNEDVAKAYEEYALKYLIFFLCTDLKPDFFSCEKEIPSDLLIKGYRERIEEFKVYKRKLELLEAPQIPLSSLLDVLNLAVPSASSYEILSEAMKLKKEIQDHLNGELFLNRSSYLTIHLLSNFWVQSTEEGVWIVCCPNEVNKKTDVNERSAIDLFIPKHMESLPTLGICTIKKVEKEKLLKELENRKRAGSQFLLSDVYFSPIPIINLEPLTILKKGSNFKSLENVLIDPTSLFVGDLIWIAQDIARAIGMLGASQFLYNSLSLQSIALVEEKGSFRAKLDHFEHFASLAEVRDPSFFQEMDLDSLRFDELARSGCFSLDTDRYGLILFVSELFFLEVEGKWLLSRETLEQSALFKLLKRVSPEHHPNICFFRDCNNGFNEDFSKELISYVDQLKAQGYNAPDLIVLEQFALKMILFPLISELLLDALKVNAFYKERLSKQEDPNHFRELGPRMPSPDLIYQTLKAGEKLLWQFIQATSNSCGRTSIHKDLKVKA